MDTGYCWTCGFHETTIEPGPAMCAWCRDHWSEQHQPGPRP